ncbi:MAG: serine/threonine protein kinase, partial [Myxococcales bacterium]|nr:serine/threonine protein kinase [Myxococcales bacterium]
MALPELFGSYLLHHQLARGGTSEVFLAQTTGEFPRLCTIKRIRRELASLPEFNERFRRDAELLVRLQHGNVVQVLEVGAVEQQPFIAMEHIDGVEVSELVEKTAEQGALPPELCLHVAIEMCEAAAHLRMRRREREGSAASAHDAPWPLELMISFDGAVKIVDLGSFGALRLGSQPVRRLMRSPGYALPEVVLKRELGASADVFAVGLVLWEMLAGRRLVADDPEGYVRAVLDGRFEAPPIERRDVPGDVIRLCAEALQLDPAARLAGLEPLRKRLVESLRRVAPAYGSGAVSRLLWQRFPQLIGRAEALVARVAADAPAMSVSPSERAGRTDTYGLYDGDSAPKPRALKVGERIPGTRYRLVRMLGRGGSASVFAGQHIDLERQVAIKILSPQLQNNSEAISQFRLEARACSRISHPNIVDVIDFGELADGRFFFAMELVDGVSLADVLAKRPALSIERVIPIVRQVCKAIHAAHGQGIIHRDIKPENVMLVRRDDRESFVKVLDFGVMAHASDRQRVRVGTPGYMAPEQVAGERPTPAMDIYGLGCMFYELLASKTPYPHEPLEKFIHLQATKPPPALRSHAHAANVHEAIERVILRCLERDPEARYASMEELESAVVAAQREAEIETEWDDLAVPGQSAATTRRVAEPPKRRRSQRATPMMMFGVVLALGAIAAGAALVIDTMRRDRGRAGSGSALAHTRTGSATGSGVTQTSAGSGSARVRPLP